MARLRSWFRRSDTVIFLGVLVVLSVINLWRPGMGTWMLASVAFYGALSLLVDNKKIKPRHSFTHSYVKEDGTRVEWQVSSHDYETARVVYQTLKQHPTAGDRLFGRENRS